MKQKDTKERGKENAFDFCFFYMRLKMEEKNNQFTWLDKESLHFSQK